jgi:hypothetical protein
MAVRGNFRDAKKHENERYFQKGMTAMKFIVSWLCIVLIFFIFTGRVTAGTSGFITDETADRTIKKLNQQTAGTCSERVRAGVMQAAGFWRAEDGDQDAFTEFCCAQFLSKPEELKDCLMRCESNLQSIDGHLTEIFIHINAPQQVAMGNILPIDNLFSGYFPGSHRMEDFFKTKLAFAVLLNYPYYTLKDKVKVGPTWTRDRWAEARLAERFSYRVPAQQIQNLVNSAIPAEIYIRDYRLSLHNLLTVSGERPFTEAKKPISLWSMQEELQAQYGQKDGLKKQELILKAMERVISQEIPQAFIGKTDLDWNPYSNNAYSNGKEIAFEREKDTRYGHLKNIFTAARGIDPYLPENSNFIRLSFEEWMEMPEKDIDKDLIDVLTSPTVAGTARLIEKRLGRRLRPYDIWYSGFRRGEAYPAAELDAITEKRYPTIEAFRADLPGLLMKLGFSKERAAFLADHIIVERARGDGHSIGTSLPGSRAHLRIHVPSKGMKYRNLSVAVHELGHCVEQVFSLYSIDHPILQGAPNEGFSEAFSFIFGTHTLALLDLPERDPSRIHLKNLDTLWSTYELSGAALLNIRIWRWMYRHPEAGPAELRENVQKLARELWNEYYGPVMGVKDSEILAIYSPIIDSGLDLAKYPIGHIIQFQIEDHLKKTGLRTEMERMCILGRITPDLWMSYAVGSPITPKPLIEASEDALKVLAK